MTPQGTICEGCLFPIRVLSGTICKSLQCPMGATEWCNRHGARARVGLQGSPVGPKVHKDEFFKIVP